jgi:hypothetical protein
MGDMYFMSEDELLPAKTLPITQVGQDKSAIDNELLEAFSNYEEEVSVKERFPALSKRLEMKRIKCPPKIEVTHELTQSSRWHMQNPIFSPLN